MHYSWYHKKSFPTVVGRLTNKKRSTIVIDEYYALNFANLILNSKPKSMLDLTGKTAVITGGGSGIGRATCLLFAKQGAVVNVVDINEVQAEQTVEQIKEQSGEAYTRVCDVTQQQ